MDQQSNDPSQIASLFRSAIAAQITAIASEGISLKTLEKLQRFCAATRQALHAIETPEAKVRERFGKGTVLSDGISMMDLTGDEEAYASAPNIETYGANMPRQLISAIGKVTEKMAPKPSMKDAVDAIVAAEEAGMSEVAKMLRENLVATFGSAEKHGAVITEVGRQLPAEATNSSTPSPYAHETTADAS